MCKVTAVTISRRVQDFAIAKAVAPVRDPRYLTRAYMGYRSFGNSADRENDDLQSRLPTQSQPQSRALPPFSELEAGFQPTIADLTMLRSRRSF